MRRARALLLVIALLLSACGSGPGGPTSTGSIPGAGTIALEVQVRDAIRRFVEAYAAAPSDRGTALLAVSRGTVMTHWAAWVSIQFGQLDATISGTYALAAIRDVEEVTQPDVGPGRTVLAQVQAHVDFAITQSGADPRTVSRSLDGPMLLAEALDGWRVLDFTRDGVPLSNTVYVFAPDASLRDRGVEIGVDVLIADPNEWFLGLTVHNRADAPVGIPAAGVGLLDADDQLIGRGDVPTSVAAIPVGSSLDALIRFPVPANVTVTGLRLFVAATIEGDDQPVVVALPVEPILTALGRSTASPSP